MALDYKKAGVDIEAGYRSVELMKGYVKETMREEVLGGLGGFSGAFSLKKIKEMDDPVPRSSWHSFLINTIPLESMQLLCALTT